MKHPLLKRGLLMAELSIVALLARYERLEGELKGYVRGYAEDAVKKLEVALDVVERMQADERHKAAPKAKVASRAQLRCVHSRQEPAPAPPGGSS